MKHILSSTAEITLDLYQSIAWDGESITISPALSAEIDRTRAEFLRFVDANNERRLYGINTKHHTGAKSLLDDDTRMEYATRLPSTPPAVGDAMPSRLVRGILLARVTDAANGTAPLRASTVIRILDMLDAPLPHVPLRGAGEPGDIIPLGHLFRTEFDGTLELGEGMALINGSPVATAVISDVAVQARHRTPRIEAALALAAAAIGAPREQYSAAVARNWTDMYARDAMESFDFLTADAEASEQRAYQAPVSFRSAPRLTAWMRRAQAQAEECAEISLQSSSNNPMFLRPHDVPPLGDIRSNGGYHNPWSTPSIDGISRAWADIASLIGAQVGRLVEDPAGLPAVESESLLTGFYMSAAGWAEEARSAATTTLLGVAGGGQTDTGTPDLLAWRKASEVGDAVDVSCAILAVVAAHTLRAKRWQAPPALAGFNSDVLAAFPPDTLPVDFGQCLDAAVATVRTFGFAPSTRTRTAVPA